MVVNREKRPFERVIDKRREDSTTGHHFSFQQRTVSITSSSDVICQTAGGNDGIVDLAAAAIAMWASCREARRKHFREAALLDEATMTSTETVSTRPVLNLSVLPAR